MSKGRSSVLAGATIYEFRMQIRRKALWIVTGLFFALMSFTGLQGPWQYSGDTPVIGILAMWTGEMQTLMPIAFGVLLADRLPRDRRLRADELLESLPGSPATRFLGKYIGATLATLAPIFLIYAAGVGYVVVDRGSAGAVPLGLAMFATASLPGLLFVAAFSISCPVVLWVPLYQFLFVGYWFWGNLLSPDSPVPNLSCPLQALDGEGQQKADDLQLKAPGPHRMDLPGKHRAQLAEDRFDVLATRLAQKLLPCRHRPL